jgi:MoxR-like ATPase
MEERQVTVLNETHALPRPFFVLATQNPVELEGTYPLPEAQLDRFLMKLLLVPPSPQELQEVLLRTTGVEVPEAEPVVSPADAADQIEVMKRLVRYVVMADPMYQVLVRMIAALTPGSEYATPFVKQYVRFGPGPRGAQAVVLSAKVLALLDGRINVSFDDIRSVLLPTLRHRLILNFQAEADGVSADQLIEQVRNAK